MRSEFVLCKPLIDRVVHRAQRAMDSFEDTAISFEKNLNSIDWIPFASQASGVARISFSLVQMALAVSYIALRMFQALLKESQDDLEESWRGVALLIHAGANFVRGSIALSPGLNLTLLVYDAAIGRFNYAMERMEKGIYPLNQNYA